jgi:hypothetical protein
MSPPVCQGRDDRRVSEEQVREIYARVNADRSDEVRELLQEDAVTRSSSCACGRVSGVPLDSLVAHLWQIRDVQLGE